MARIEKEKNIIYYYPDTNEKRPQARYEYNINDNIFRSLNGRPLKTLPSDFYFDLQNSTSDFCKVLHYIMFRNHIKSLMDLFAHQEEILLADKLINLGMNHADCKDFIRFPNRASYILKNFTRFVKWFNANKQIPTLITYDRFNKYCSVQDILPMIQDMLNTLTEANIEEIADWYTGHINEEYMSKQHVKTYACYLLRHYDTFFSSNAAFHGYIHNYFTMCYELDELPERKNFFTHYIHVKQSYAQHKDVIDSTKIKRYYMAAKSKLQYSNDDLCVILPTTTTDFIKEADQQQNCVFNWYLPRVLAKQTYVVFIRKKNAPEKSYITCEVTADGLVKQYLKRFNQEAREEIDMQFLNEYSAFLKEHWHE